MELIGDNYQVGRILAQKVKTVPGLSYLYQVPKVRFSNSEQQEVFQLFNMFCPGVNEEIAGFSDELGIPAERVNYYSRSYLIPGCSQIIILPKFSEDGNILIGRNYDFSEQWDEMQLFTTRINGRLSHIGSCMALFGRSEGMNEDGLVVSFSSAGTPVSGELQISKKPTVVGLQFWAIIRALLEQCGTVAETINLLKEIPIACNMNMIIADKFGEAALVGTYDGKMAIKRIGYESEEGFLGATNHVILPELAHCEPIKMHNSLVRYELIKNKLGALSYVGINDMKKLLSEEYPKGLSCSYYDDFFGTLRSLIFMPTNGSVDVCFGSPSINDWYRLYLNDEVKKIEYKVKIKKEKGTIDFFAGVDISIDK
jgi:predicted choloylglycine hydrolase